VNWVGEKRRQETNGGDKEIENSREGVRKRGRVRWQRELSRTQQTLQLRRRGIDSRPGAAEAAAVVEPHDATNLPPRPCWPQLRRGVLGRAAARLAARSDE